MNRRKNESRSLFKNCFKNAVFSFVPFEIWRDLIVSSVDLKTITLISQTCWGFKELVDQIGERNLNLALMFRKEGQMVFGLKYLQMCAEFGNEKAMIHLGFASLLFLFHFFKSKSSLHIFIGRDGGWGLDQDDTKEIEWFKRAAECGDPVGMASYAISLKFGFRKEICLGDLWGKKALESRHSFAVGLCHLYGLGTEVDAKKTLPCFETALTEANNELITEFIEYYLGYCFHFEDKVGKDFEKAIYWYKKSGDKGFAEAQFWVGGLYLEDFGVQANFDHAIIWIMKSAKQRHFSAMRQLDWK